MRQYTWVMVNKNRVTATHLDRNDVSKQLSSQIIDCSITPIGFTDHNLVSLIVPLCPLLGILILDCILGSNPCIS